MALKRWRWIWGPALAAAAVAVLILPPALPVEKGLLSFFGLAYSPWSYPPGAAHRAAIRMAVEGQRRRLRESVLADSVLAAARGSRTLRSADGAVTVVYEPPLKSDSALAWLRAAVAELDLYPKWQGRGVPIVVALLSNPRRQSDPRDQYLESSVLWLSRWATRDRACIVTLNLVRRGRPWRPRFSLVVQGPSGTRIGRFLDLCALEGRFGSPGAGVAQLVDWSPNWYWRIDLLTTRLYEARRDVRKEDVQRAWQYSFWYGQVSWVVVGCLDGSDELCARSAGLSAVGRPPAAEYYFDRRLVLSHLLANGTADQFAAFWRSPLAPGNALEQAYHRPPGHLAYDAFRHWYSVPQSAPRAEPRLILAGFFWAGAALALALVAGRRWKTDI